MRFRALLSLAISLVLTLAAAAPAALAADGLSLEPDTAPTSRWVMGLNPVLGGTQAAGFGPSATLGVTGDYYFGAEQAPREGLLPSGLRASAGLWLGRRAGDGLSVPALQGAAADGLTPPTSMLPYLGLGYTLADDSGLSLRADLGLLARGAASGVRLGRAYGAGPSFDDLVRDLRLLPVLQLGVSYSF